MKVIEWQQDVICNHCGAMLRICKEDLFWKSEEEHPFLKTTEEKIFWGGGWAWIKCASCQEEVYINPKAHMSNLKSWFYKYCGTVGATHVEESCASWKIADTKG